MNFDKLFKSLSYTAVFCGFLAMWVSGTFGVIGTVLFVGMMIAAWFLEGSRWQISERMGTVLIVAALPFFYLLFRNGFFQFADHGHTGSIVGSKDPIRPVLHSDQFAGSFATCLVRQVIADHQCFVKG